MRRRIALVTMLVLVAIPLAAAPAAAKDPDRVRHERVVAYWTAERMASAKPRDFIRVGGTFKPAAKPDKGPGKPGGGGGGGGSSEPTVTGASWNGDGTVLKASGKVFFTMGGTNYVCSGAVAQDSRSSHSLVLTAAHCAYDEAEKAFATNWTFIPEYDSAPTRSCAQTTHGCWTAQGLVVHKGYADESGFTAKATEHDFAFAIVGPGGKSNTQLDATVGWFPITFSASNPDHRYAFGYPAAGKYRGNDLVYCAGTIFEDGYNANKTWGMGCDMTGGSSGGPWFSSFSSGSGTLSSLNSYGYSGLKNMYGPKFDSRTQAVYTKANSSTGDTIAP